MEEPLSLAETALGLIAFKGDDIEFYRFKSVEEAVDYYRGTLSPGVTSFLRRWKGKVILVERRSSSKALMTIGLKPVLAEPLNKALELRSDIISVLKILNLSIENYRDLAKDVATKLVGIRVEELAKRRDLDIVMAMQAYDDLIKMLNILQERILIWIKEREQSLLEEHKDIEKIIERIASPDGPEPTYVKKMAELYIKTKEYRNATEGHICMLMDENAPNLSTVIGHLLGARLISKVGSLSRLASLPASTIQILGAEKALFRAMRKRGRPPKHGIIFQHPWVHGSPKRIRGKAARVLASRIAIAARVDCFSARFIGDKLKKDVEGKLKGLGGEKEDER